MKEYILTGHRIIIEQVWCDVTALQADPTIQKEPKSVRLERIVNRENELHQAVIDYLTVIDYLNATGEEL
jgi:hypothetical protein